MPCRFSKVRYENCLFRHRKNTDDFTQIPDNNIDYSHVTWDQLDEMLSCGLVEVQNHTYNLHSITKNRYGCMQRPRKRWKRMSRRWQTIF
jgi:hypothetical protein